MCTTILGSGFKSKMAMIEQKKKNIQLSAMSNTESSNQFLIFIHYHGLTMMQQPHHSHRNYKLQETGQRSTFQYIIYLDPFS